jgi:hypothetical protein
MGTSHHLSSRFLAFQEGIEQLAVFEHGAGDVEKTVADGAQSTGMAATAGLQSKILGFALLIASSGGVSQVVNRIPIGEHRVPLSKRAVEILEIVRSESFLTRDSINVSVEETEARLLGKKSRVKVRLGGPGDQ